MVDQIEEDRINKSTENKVAAIRYLRELADDPDNAMTNKFIDVIYDKLWQSGGMPARDLTKELMQEVNEQVSIKMVEVRKKVGADKIHLLTNTLLSLAGVVGLIAWAVLERIQ